METETVNPPSAPAAAPAPKSGNLSTEDLAQMVARSRRAKSSSGAPASASVVTQPNPITEPNPAPESALETLETTSNQPAPGTVPTTEIPAAGDDDAAQAEAPDLANEAEAQAQPGEGEDGDEESEEAAPGADPGKTIAKLQKRIRKQTAKYERELESLRTEVAQLKEQPAPEEPARRKAPVNAQEPFFWRPEVQEINGKISEAERVIAFAEANPDGAEIERDGKTISLEPAQLRAIAANAQRTLARLEAQKMARIEHLTQEDTTARTRYTTEAVKIYPWMNNKTSAQYQEALEVLRENPGITARPDYLLMIGDYIAGRAERLAKGKATANGAAKPKPATPPKSIVTAPAAAVQSIDEVETLRRKHAEARADFQKNGSIDNQARLIAIERRLKAAQKAA